MSNVFGYIPGNDAGSATSIALTPDDTLGQYFIPFSKTSKKKGNKLYIDNSITPLTYDPSTGALTATTFIGGVAATDIALSQTATGSPNYLVMSSTASGVSTLKTSPAGATYNETNNTAALSISGNAASADTATNQSGGSVNATTGNFSGAVGINGILTMGNTAITSASSVEALNFYGDLTGIASKATQIFTKSNNNNAVHYLTFSDINSSPGAYISLKTHSGIKCNPSGDSITADTFVGDLTGTADKATDIVGGGLGQILYQTSADNTDFLGVGTANQVLISNAGASAPSWSTDIQGNAGSATTIRVDTTVPAAIYNIPFCLGTGTGKQLLSNSTLTYDTTVTPAAITADFNGTSTKVKITANSVNSSNYITFAATTGSQDLLCSTSKPISCNPYWGDLQLNEVNIGRGHTEPGMLNNTFNLFMGRSTPISVSYALNGGRNTVIGNGSGINMLSASSHWNTLLGDECAQRMSSGAGNTYIGKNAGPSFTGGVVYGTGNDNVAVGVEAAYGMTSGGYNSYLGRSAGWDTTSGTYNVAIGYESGYYLRNSTNNVCVGAKVGRNSTDTIGSFNTIVGSSAGLKAGPGTYNTYIGALSGPQSVSVYYEFHTGSYNTAVGVSAGGLLEGTSNQNTLIGKNAGYGNSNANNNVFVGYNSGFQSAGGSGTANVCVGAFAGDSMITTANGNTLIGYLAGSTITTGTNNTVVGSQAGTVLTGNNNIVIGDGVEVPTPANSNQIVIGKNTSTLFIQGQFNLKIGATIVISTTFTYPISGQFFIVTMSSASRIITLPDPADAKGLGCYVIFKRKGNTTAFNITAAGANTTPIMPINGTGALTTLPVTTSIFQVNLVCDGTHWSVIGQA